MQSSRPRDCDAILEPLNLRTTAVKTSVNVKTEADFCECLLCDAAYSADDKHRNDLLKHFLESHKLVIAEVPMIADFVSYIAYWKERLKCTQLEEICSVIKSNCGANDIGLPEKYYLLADILPEDKSLRQNLQRKKLECVLEIQQKERENETFTHGCLFCKEHFTGNRATLFNHMALDHNFNIGKPDNIVFAEEFLDLLQEKLTNLQCLYCEKVFKDRATLKEHMRKKQHKKIDPRNKIYDKFYVINYLELGKNWEVIQAEIDAPAIHSDTDNENDEDWNDWQEEGGNDAVCLFCDESKTTGVALLHHMKEIHCFDMQKFIREQKLYFYQKLKLVNYIRRQIHQCLCIFCSVKFDTKQKLMTHMVDTGHISTIPSQEIWDLPQYYFPTYENDNLLYSLEDNDEDDDSDEEDIQVPEAFIIGETIPSVNGILMDKNVRDEILNT
ncbi:zinc finger protein 277-like [Tubulanus polymorphus]|uniref:zinc finger protein 277-like n=1 Tax=Tubulanus polymorphus TaxID=672921 RepID=UPI003DA2722B